MPLTKAHLKLLDSHVAHNKDNPNKLSLKIVYKKLNGRTVKRKVDPHSTRNGLLFGYDHKRKATRSYRLDRMIGMEKAAFIRTLVPLKTQEAKDKFTQEKSSRGAAGLGVAGAVGGGYLGHTLAKSNHAFNFTNAPLPLKHRVIGTGIGAALGAGAGALIGHHLGKKHGKRQSEKGVGEIRSSSLEGMYDKIHEYRKLNNDHIKTAFFRGFEKRAGMIANALNKATGANFGHAAELGGLGLLAAHPAYELAKGKDKVRNSLEVGGLGVLAAPTVAHVAKAMITKHALFKNVDEIRRLNEKHDWALEKAHQNYEHAQSIGAKDTSKLYDKIENARDARNKHYEKVINHFKDVHSKYHTEHNNLIKEQINRPGEQASIVGSILVPGLAAAVALRKHPKTAIMGTIAASGLSTYGMAKYLNRKHNNERASLDQKMSQNDKKMKDYIELNQDHPFFNRK